MSFLNSSVEIKTIKILSPHITKTQVLGLLHDHDKMIHTNPSVKSHKRVPPSSSTAFFRSVPASQQPSNSSTAYVYEVVETTSSAEESAGSWRGGWAKRFIPDSITYETSLESREEGMRTITHAPMGVHSFTMWVLRDPEEGQEGFVLEKTGLVTSNRMLMRFIKTTIHQSYEKLFRDFVVALEKEVAAEGGSETEVEKVN